MDNSLQYLCYLVHCKNEANKVRKNAYAKRSRLWKKILLERFPHDVDYFLSKIKYGKELAKKFEQAEDIIEYEAGIHRSHTPKIRKLRELRKLKFFYNGSNKIVDIYDVSSNNERQSCLGGKTIQQYHDDYIVENILLGGKHELGKTHQVE